MPWFQRSPHLLAEMTSALCSHFPALWLAVEGTTAVIRGCLSLRDPVTGLEYDRYTVVIELAEDYQKSLPIVRET